MRPKLLHCGSPRSAATLAAGRVTHWCNPGRKPQNGSEIIRRCFRIGHEAAMTTIYTFGPFRLDVAAEILFRRAEPVALGKRAVALLHVLVEEAGTPISKSTLIESAWPGLAIEDSNLTVQIAALRRVFAEESGGEKWIETLPRRGYRYVGPVLAKEDHSEASG